MDVSQALNALVCPTAGDSDRQKISEATAVLSNAKSSDVILSLSKIAFNEQEAVERREGALVLLRSRLLLWDPLEDEQLKQTIQQALSSALMSAKDDLLAWRVASVVSALFCTHSNPHAASWHELCHSAVAYLQSVAQGTDQAALFSALTLIKAIFADGGSLGDMKATFPPYLKCILSRGWNAKDPQMNKLTCEAVGAVIQSYCVSVPTVPQECCELLTEAMRVILNALETRACATVADMIEILVATVDVRPAEAGVWTEASVDTLIRCLQLCLAPNALKTRTFAQVEAQHFLHIATSAVIALSDQQGLQSKILEPLWSCLISCLAMPIPGPSLCSIEDVASFWEMRRDDEECAISSELPDESPDLSIVAWEEIDRILTALDSGAGRCRVMSSAERLLRGKTETAVGLGEVYAGWVLLAVLLGAKVEDLSRDFFAPALEGWAMCFSLASKTSDDLQMRFASARVRWGALLFMNEIIANYGEALAAEPCAIEILHLLQTNAKAETVPRVKSKCLMTFCQLAAQMGDENEQLINDYYMTWLLPSLACPRLLEECQSLTRRPFDLEDEDTQAMEILLRELTLAAMSTTCTSLGPGLLQHYGPVMTHCLHLLAQAPANAEACSICEAILEFATRLIECVGLLMTNAASDEPTPETLIRASTDCVDLLRTIVRLDAAVQNLNNSHDTNRSAAVTRTGLFSSSFERTLLQAAARVIAVVDSSQVVSELRSVLAIVQRKLTGCDTVSVSDAVSSKPLGAAGYTLQSNDRTTTLTVAHAAGLEKVININSTLIEEQVASLSFLGVTAEKIIPVLQPEETASMVRLIEDLTRSTILPDVRRNGLECLKEIIELPADRMRVAGREAANRGVEPCCDEVFIEALKAYMNFWLELMQLGRELLKEHMKLRHVNELVYVLADISDGGRDAALIVGKRSLSDLAVFNGQQVQDHITELSKLFHKALISDDKVNATSHVRLGEDGGDEDDDVFGIGCDAVMQFLSRVFKAFGNLARPGFNILKPVFATLLTTEEISVVARTAALVVFASAADAQQGGEGNEQLLPVALLFARCLDVDSRISDRLRAALPSADNLPAAKSVPNDVELLKPCVGLLREIATAEQASKDDECIIEDFIDHHQTEVMRVQAAVYAVGVVAQSAADFKVVENQLPAIEDTFNNLLTHPLACLASRRVILDCLACACVKIMLRMSDLRSDEKRGLFSVAGLVSILKNLLPLRDDAEDGQATHDVLIDWALGRITNFPQWSSENVSPQMLELTRSAFINLARVLRMLSDEREENAELLSFQAKHQKQLDLALQALAKTTF